MVKPAGTINVGLKELGPFFVQSTLPIGEGLLSQDLDHQTQPLLAEPWSISEDFLTWTFKLHKGIQFHKGYEEMTADDVVWSMKGFQHSKHPRAGQLKRF